ncbi:MAG: ATP-dependent DNA helicase RecG [Lachnospiraceae bacterium]|nr:ATP-dependent DNA helicase RecG [Lachnospiraceae bacterium]
MTELTNIKSIKGIGEKTAALFNKVGVFNVYDTLIYYPRDYDRYTLPQPLAVLHERLSPGDSELVTVAGTVFGSARQKRVRQLTITNLSIKDEKEPPGSRSKYLLNADDQGNVSHNSNILHLTYFNMPYLSKVFKAGNYYIFRGKVEKKGTELHMEQAKIFKENDYRPLVDTLQPRYPLTAGLSNNIVMKTLKQVLSHYSFPLDHLPEKLRTDYQLLGYQEAVEKIHFPRNYEDVIAARKRLVFDEFFLFIIAVRHLRDQTRIQKSTAVMMEVAEAERLLETLPYRLTSAQLRVWSEIKIDLSGQYIMNRLIQGDVGSGKTILAFLSLLMCIANGYQGALMAPTEVLATQHYQSLIALSENYKLPFRPVLLTGSVNAAARRQAYEKINSGEANVIIGTHALIQEKVIYKNLALVITDEQHRFGVRQRESLAGKGANVHVLVMSATPIPRTLAIIIYGDLNLSVIDELPANRLPIKNCVVGNSYRETAYKFITSEVKAGHQVYIICPMVLEGELEGVENVTDYTAKLKLNLPDDIVVAALHGKMRPAEKNRIMSEFAARNIDIIVSTTVIEVGINVPNATVMMVENAERFGLAQLHQLRGRVGRGAAQSYCIFVNGSGSKETMKRLEILNKSNDGFHIASEDLKIRGPGDLFGIRQSGIMDFHLGDIYQDANILKDASAAADEIGRQIALLSDLCPSYNEELQSSELLRLKNFIDQGMLKFVDFRSI